jgi:hypothetical protein
MGKNPSMMRRDLGVPETWGIGIMAIFPPGPSAIFDDVQSGPRNVNVAPPLPSEPTNKIVCPPNFPAVTAYADSREIKDLLFTCTSLLLSHTDPAMKAEPSRGGPEHAESTNSYYLAITFAVASFADP